jgi:hypothetical protein
VLALPALAACNDDGCDSNASAVQTFAKPGGGSGGKGGSKGGSKSEPKGGDGHTDDDCDED